MLQSIDLHFTETGTLQLPGKGITIFVGPNNSGKSLALREVERVFEVHPLPSDLRILKDYQVEWPSKEAVTDALKKMEGFGPTGQAVGHVAVGRINPAGNKQAGSIPESSLFHVIEQKTDKHWLTTQFLRWGVVRLDGRSRFNLTNDQSGGDLLGPPANVLMHLFQDKAARLKVQALIKDAFDLYFVVDPTHLGKLRIRLSSQKPLADEQSLNTEAREFHSKATHIKDASDGVQAFTGIVTAVCSGDFHTLLVDEPEAFLHPPLARKLGKSLANIASERNGSLMAATHSADFLMGCVQASSNVRVVRLEYNSGKSRARMIDPKVLDTFFKRPLMRSANVISALFHDGVVICESDNDRAFYNEIYHRLVARNSQYPSILFINAQNKQTVKDMVGPLRQFGVPAAAIVDIDFVKDGGATWMDWLKASQMPVALQSGFGQQRAAIKDALVATGKDMKTDGGIDILDSNDKAAAEHMFDNLEEYGMFPVRRGELESWLPSLGVPGKKTDWAIAMLERLGSDPTDPSYVHPGHDDVWQFLERIVAWISDPARKGTG